MYYVYQISHEEYDDPWYIGISKNPQQRLRQHLATNKAIREMLDQIRIGFPENTSLDVTLEIIDQAETLSEAQKLERTWIMRKVPLLNTRHNPQRDYKYKQEMLLLRISDMLKPYGLDQASHKELLWKLIDLIMEEGR